MSRAYTGRIEVGLGTFGALGVLLAVVLFAFPVKVAAFSGGGAGTGGDPYQVTNCAQLQSLNDDPTAYYKLTQDVDCNGVAFVPIASGGTFTGSLDGQGNQINNVTINVSGSSFTGLFSRISSTAVIKNMAIFADVTSDSNSTGIIAGAAFGDSQVTNVGAYGLVSCIGGSNQYCGGAVGFLSTHAQMSKTYSTAYVTSEGSHVGGLVGRAEGDTPSDRVEITNSYFNGTVVAAGDNAGGLAGSASNTTVTSSYATGSVTGVDVVGGLAGVFSGLMAETFSAIKVVGVGGAVGPVTGHFDSGSVGNRYFDTVKTGFSSSPDGSSPISDPNYFLGNSTNPPLSTWDFSSIWVTNYQDYPSFAPLVDPYMECEQLVITETTAHIHCQVQPPGWGTPTWEFRYRKASSNLWTNVPLPDVHRNEVTVAGLTSGTDYVFQFRYTNNFGVGPWGSIFGTTLGVAPPEPVADAPEASGSSRAASLTSAANPAQDTPTTIPTTPVQNQASEPVPTSAQEPAPPSAEGLPASLIWGGAILAALGLVWAVFALAKRSQQ